ncbi:MAG: S1 RNA-binding domain-containing protein, partial [Spirochaetes bacterium]|nr:S1 RNA-binding domain-containing protein [Spirochaetota bacterium]
MSDLNVDTDIDFEKSFQDTLKDLEENTIIKATVIDISGDTVFLDFGYKSEAKVPLADFEKKPEIGDEEEVFLVREVVDKITNTDKTLSYQTNVKANMTDWYTLLKIPELNSVIKKIE